MLDKPPTGVSGEGQPPYEEEFRAIGRILERDAAPIMERWFERATEEQVHAAEHQRIDAMNELLEMLQSLGQRLHQQSSQALEVASQLAREHGVQRFDLKWDIVDLVRDYEILQGVILEHLGQVLDERLTYRQAMIIASMVNGAIGHAVESYSAMTQQRLEQQVKRQQADLRQLTLDLTEAEHHERHRIAARLHDDLQQMLVAVRMRLDLGLNSAALDPSLKEAITLVDHAVGTTRNLAADLHPYVLEHKGLPEAVAWLGEMFQKWYGLTVTVDLQSARDCGLDPLPLRRLVYDAIRELLFNIVKHAQTDQAWVKIACDNALPWRIEIEDRGVGSAELAREAPSGHGFGLGSVRHRVRQVGGTMEIDSRPGEGTRVVLTVPMAPA